MIAPVPLPIAVEVPEDYRVPDEAIEIIARLLLDAADKALEAEREEPRDGAAV